MAIGIARTVRTISCQLCHRVSKEEMKKLLVIKEDQKMVIKSFKPAERVHQRTHTTTHLSMTSSREV